MKKQITTALLAATAVFMASCTVEEPDDEVLAWRYQTHFGEEPTPGTNATPSREPEQTTSEYAISFTTKLGSTPASLTVKRGDYFTIPTAPAVTDEQQAAYYFDGWYYGDKKISGDHYPTSNMTLVAKWKDQACTLSIPSWDYLRNKSFFDNTEELFFEELVKSPQNTIIMNVSIQDKSDNSELHGTYDSSTGRTTLTGTYGGTETTWICQFYIDNYDRLFMQLDPDNRTFSKTEEGLVGKWTREDSEGEKWYTIITENKFTNYYGFVEYEFVEKGSTVSNNLYDGAHLYQDAYYYSSTPTISKKAAITNNKKTNTQNQSEVSK